MKNTPHAILLIAAAMALPLGSLSGAERGEPAVTASVLKQFDANHDGALDDAERAAWQADREKRKAALAARRAADLARYDSDHDGKLDRKERAARKADADKAKETRKAELAAVAEARNLLRYDRNRNGVLDPEERDALNADQQKRAAARAEKAGAAPAVPTPAAGVTEEAKPASASEHGDPGPNQAS